MTDGEGSVGVGWGVPESISILNWFPFVMESRLSPCESIVGITDVGIESEVWNDVTSWVDGAFVGSEISFERMFECGLLELNVVLGVDDFMGFSEIWDKVIDWVFSIRWCLVDLKNVGVGEEWFSGKLKSRGIGDQSNES